MPKFDHHTDEQLIEQLRLGSHAAFSEIFNRYWGILLDEAFRRLKSKEAAEEVTQDVLVSIYLRRQEVEPKSSLAAYLKTALKYKVIDAFRAQQRYYRSLDHVGEGQPPHGSDAGDALELNELRSQIRQVADKLPPKCRQVFMLSRFEELNHQEIADQLGITTVTVKSHLNRALKILREELGHHHLGLIMVGIHTFLF